MSTATEAQGILAGYAPWFRMYVFIGGWAAGAWLISALLFWGILPKPKSLEESKQATTQPATTQAAIATGENAKAINVAPATQTATANGEKARAINLAPGATYNEGVDTSEIKKKLDNLQESLNATFQAQQKQIADMYPLGYGVLTITKSREVIPIKIENGAASFDWSTARILSMDGRYIQFLAPAGSIRHGGISLNQGGNQAPIERRAGAKTVFSRIFELVFEATIVATTNDGDMLVFGARPMGANESSAGAMINFQVNNKPAN